MNIMSLIVMPMLEEEKKANLAAFFSGGGGGGGGVFDGNDNDSNCSSNLTGVDDKNGDSENDRDNVMAYG